MDDRFPMPSFRDPDGRIVILDGRVLRFMRRGAPEMLRDFSETKSGRRLIDSGKIQSWRTVNPEDPVVQEVSAAAPGDASAKGWTDVIEHERVPFATYAHEWPAAMLAEAAKLTLEIARDLLEDGYGLKDATPYNVLFKGARPVHVDVLSVERRDPSDPIWLAEVQFLQAFLLPLLSAQTFGDAPHRHFLMSRGGVTAETLYRKAGILRRFSPSFLGFVSMPVLLSGMAEKREQTLYKPRRVDPARAAYTVRYRIKRLTRAIDHMFPAPKKSAWSDYEATRGYDKGDLAIKEAFVVSAIERFSPTRVLDLGCNKGQYSIMAAERGASVVACDFDPLVVGKLWQVANARSIDILPLVVDLAQPAPALGWRNAEFPSFLSRARGNFDCVLALAIIHHLLVTERVPMSEVVELIADMTLDIAVMEYVSPEDPNFKRLCRGRDALYAHLTEEAFVSACQARFELVDRRTLETGNRTLLLFKRR